MITVSAEMNSVHIALIKVAVVKIEGYVINLKIRDLIEGYCKVYGILKGKGGKTEIFYVIEQKAKSRVALGLISTAEKGIRILIFVVVIPYSTADFDILSRRIGRISVYIIKKFACYPFFCIVFGYVF